MEQELQQNQEKHLQKGIGILYDMEKNNYLMTKSISELEKRASCLGNPKDISRPMLKKIENKMSFLDTISVLAGPTGFVGAIVGGIVGLITGIISCKTLDLIIAILFGWLIIACVVVVFALIGAGIGIGVGALLGVGADQLDRKNTKTKNMQFEKEYAAELEKYKSAKARDEVRVKKELQERKEILRQRDCVQQRLDDATETLEKFYNQMNIHPQYRNLIAIGYMNKFVELGIATKLGGADGLYYLIMKELQWEQLKFTLNNIVNRFDELIEKTNRLHDDLREMNATCEIMVNKTSRLVNEMSKSNQLNEKIKENTAVTAYNSERMAKELEFKNFMDYYWK